MRIIKILTENRNLRLYWVSTSLSHISGVMFSVVSAYIFLQNSASFYSAVVGITLLVSALIRFPSGYVSDRLDRRKTIVLIRLLQSIVILFPILGTQWMVISFLVFNALSSLNVPLSAGLVQSILEKRQMVGGTSLNSLAISVSSLIGASLSALFPVLGIVPYLIIVALMRGTTSLFIGNITVRKRSPSKLTKTPISFVLLPSLVLSILGVTPIMLNTVVFVQSPQEISLSTISFLTTLGNIFGAIAAGELVKEDKIRLFVYGSLLGLSVTLIGISVLQLLMIYPLLFVRGFLSTMETVSIRSDLRIRVPNEIMGRVWGSVTTVSSLSSALITLIYSGIVEIFGTRLPLEIFGLLLLSLSFLMIGNGGVGRKNPRTGGPRESSREEGKIKGG
ncbi:MFS transporter [Metallosphaera tengchongensis]|uniref:MFS transporter n=1 Tax=Metallosphaera tengchongensis TaxID=1532350 RepID=A0A6N0NSI1_9CREN|nr:MFS transporter [Metallosphaera tengchongensis]QKQ99661.1 MFS transporter [Metallosphaera tengchongensis]